MKKVLFTSMVLLSVLSWTGNVYAQDAATGTEGTEIPATPATAQAKVTFTPSGKTLTISGQGDLTTYMTTDYSARVFTDKAVDNVFVTEDGNTVSVKEGDSFSSSSNYFKAVGSYSKVCEKSPATNSTYFWDVKENKSWNESKITNLYVGSQDWQNIFTFAKVTVETSLDQYLASWNQWTDADGNKKSYIFVVEGDVPSEGIKEDDFASNKITALSIDDLSAYLNVVTTYKVSDNYLVYVSADGGNNYKKLQPQTQYTWEDGEVFYIYSATYEAIADNDAFFGEKGTHPEYIQAVPKELSFNDLLLRKITEGTYEKVEFVNESSDACLINSATIQSILFPNAGMNNDIKELDLGQVTLNNFSSADLGRTSDAATCMSLETLTLPLTNKTTVKSETTQTDVSKMVVPSSIIPKGYTYTGNNLTTVHIPEGYERVGDEAFKGNAKISQVTFPTTLEVIGDRAFQTCGALREIVFNEGLQNIGEQSFAGNSLTSVKFPSSLLIINDGAFETADQVNRFSIKLNAGLKYIGNSAFALGAKYDEEVLEIPASVRYIGPFAFNFRQYQDVYFYGQKAPFMPIGKAKFDRDWGKGTAFSEHTLDGNTGFDPKDTKNTGADNCSEGYANRENYKNGGAYFCILHYPKDLDDTDRATYTDITRIYKTDPSDTFHKDDVDSGHNGPLGADIVGEEEGTISFGQANNVGKRVNWGYQDTYLGAQYIWPSQAQFSRAYATASNGLCWNGKTTYRPELTEGDLAVLAYAGYNFADDGVTNEEKGVYSMDDLQKIAHLGTRQFVLANADVNEDTEPEKEPEYPIHLTTGQWWTLCVPFNMTKKQVLETFGDETQLCLFYQVERRTSKGRNSILLKFTKDVLNYKSADDSGKLKDDDGKWLYDEIASSTKDDDIVVWAHESYMIKPMKGENSDKEPTFVVKNYALVVGNPLPTVVEAVHITDLQDDDYSKEYRFVGNYLCSTDANPVVIPQYSYIYAKTTSDPTYKFRFYIGKKAVWAPNKSIVQSHDRQGGLLDYNNFFGSDNSALPQSAKQASIFGDDSYGETTGIDDVTIIAGSDVLTPVFTLDGKMVSANGNTDGLAKGVYVKAGKKFIVK